MKGMRQQKVKSTKQKTQELEKIVENLQMALQMSQMMVKHLSSQVSALQSDVTNSMSLLNDFQYRTLAMLEVGNFDKQALEAKANEIKLDKFNKASDQEDLNKNYANDDAGTLNEESVVILTSSTPDLSEDQGIFRSKFHMSECQTPELREKLLGSKVNDVFEIVLNGVKHSITVLGLRIKKQEEVVGENSSTEQE